MPEDAGVAPEDRYCDLVMKGGITSGVVYPLAIWTLAKHYRFKNIGGTSCRRYRRGGDRGRGILPPPPRGLVDGI